MDQVSRDNGSAGWIAFGGSAGSHPATIRAITAALSVAAPKLKTLGFDLTTIDSRSTADYVGLTDAIVRVTPADIGLSDFFPVRTLNFAISGGNRRFEHLVRRFEAELARQGVRAVLLCHAWGLASQALMRAANRLDVPAALIDEGPFSVPLHGRLPETSRWTARLAFGTLRALGLFPQRDLSGDGFARVYATAPGRGRELIRRGVDATKVRVVACPRLGYLAGIRKRIAQRGRDAGPPGILWIHQPFESDGRVRPSEWARAETSLARGVTMARSECGATLRVRMHPRSSAAEVERMRALLGDEAVEYSPASRTLADDLLDTSLCVGFYSSVLLEAMACDVPVVASRLSENAFGERLEAQKATALAAMGVPVAATPAELAGLILEGLAGSAAVPAEKVIDREIGSLDHDGSMQVALDLLELRPGRARSPRDRSRAWQH